MDPSRDNSYAFERGFLWVRFMGDEIPGATTHFLCDHFDGKTIPANNILYNISWAPAQKEKQAENIMVAAGIEPLTSR
jgi:hypothetical protein